MKTKLFYLPLAGAMLIAPLAAAVESSSHAELIPVSMAEIIPGEMGNPYLDERNLQCMMGSNLSDCYKKHDESPVPLKKLEGTKDHTAEKNLRNQILKNFSLPDGSNLEKNPLFDPSYMALDAEDLP